MDVVGWSGSWSSKPLRDLGRAMISNVSSHHVRGKNTFTKYFINTKCPTTCHFYLFIAQWPEINHMVPLEPRRSGNAQQRGKQKVGREGGQVEELTLKKHTPQTSGIPTSRST